MRGCLSSAVTTRRKAATIAAASRRVDDPRATAPWQVVITVIVVDAT